MPVDLSSFSSLFTSNSVYFLGFSCFLGTQAKHLVKKANGGVKMVVWLLFTALLVYKSFSYVSNKQNKMKIFDLGDKFDRTKFKTGYKTLMQQLHPDISGFESAEEFGEIRRFYEAFENKVQPEKLWEIYVMFGDEFNIFSDEDIKRQTSNYAFTIHNLFEFLLRSLMIFLVSYYFYLGSAQRGFYCKMSLAISSLIYFSL